MLAYVELAIAHSGCGINRKTAKKGLDLTLCLDVCVCVCTYMNFFFKKAVVVSNDGKTYCSSRNIGCKIELSKYSSSLQRRLVYA